MHDTAQGN